MRNLLLLANGGVWLIIFFIVVFFSLPCGFTACLLILSVIFVYLLNLMKVLGLFK